MTVDDEKPAAEAGAQNQPPVKKTDGNASFLRAARAGNLDKVLEYLKGSTDINTSNANGLNALHLASKEGHTNVVQELLKRGANVDAQTKKGNTALHISSLAGKEEVVKILVEHGAKVNIQSEIGFTPLYMAAQENHAEVVKFLLKNGASPSIATNDGFTPLAVALQQGRDKVVAVLLEADSKGKVKLPALHIAAKKDDVNAASLLLRNEHNVDLQSKSGFTPLHIAAHYGNVNVATLLLEQGADISFKARNNITPLHVSCKWGRFNMVVLLLDKGADINIRTRDGLSPLHCGARSGHTQVVDLLLERKATHSCKTRNGLTALHMAAQGDHEDCARLLLHYKASVDDVTVDYLTALHVAAHCGNVNTAKLLLDRKCEVNARALNGFTPLHIACKKNRIKVVELLLKYGAAIEATTESGLTPLHVAAFMGHMNIVLFLLQHNANPDYPTVRGETPLHLAARANQTDIMRILLRNGATVDAKAREQQTPLHIAARLGNVDNVVLLLQHGASADATTKDLYTPLHIASKEGQEEVASVLVDQGASLNLTTKKGFTPLHIAAKYGNIKVARLLLQRGANADVQGKNGLTPLHVAAHYNNVNVALLLLDSGASPHCTAKNGYTPLHIAAKKNQMDIATTLLEYNAKPNAESKNGFTPLHLASQEGHTDMVSLLLEHGAAAKHPAHNGLTPMHLCAQEDKTNVAEILVKYEADKDPATKAGYTPLHTACHFGQINMIRFLLEQDANVNAKTKQGYTPLHQAAQQGHVLVIKLLLKYQASPNVTANNGQTPLSLAQHLGYISVEEVLKEVTEVQSIKTGAIMDEKYKVQAPEMMQETFMSDSEDEGEDDTILGDTNYSYLNTDQFIGMKDDSITPAKGGYIEQFSYTGSHEEFRQYPNDDSIQLAQGMPNRESMGMSPGFATKTPDETMEVIWGSDPNYEKQQKRGHIVRAGDPNGSMLPQTPSYLPRTPFDKKYQDEFFAMDALEESHISPEEKERMRLQADSSGVESGSDHLYRGRDSYRERDTSHILRAPDTIHSMELEDGETLGNFERSDTMRHIWGGETRRPPLDLAEQNDQTSRMDPSRKACMATSETFDESTMSPEERSAAAQFVYGVDEETQRMARVSPQGRYVSGRLVGPDGKVLSDVTTSKVQFDAQEIVRHQSDLTSSMPPTQYGNTSEDQLEAQVQRSNYAGVESFSPSSAPYGTSMITSPYGGGSYSGANFTDSFDPDNVVVDRTPVYSGFLVSFMVDARGGAMRGCRHSGVRVIVPPGMASQPTRVTCRLVKKEKLLIPPPLMEGEALASRVIELGPAHAQFLGPVIIEIPHFASLRGREREVVVLRSNNGEKWVEHTLEASDDMIHDILKDSFEGEELEPAEELAQKRITRIVTTEFPQYFAIISRVRQETKQIGADGGVISSTVVPQVQAVFPEGALTKNIKVGLQAQPVSTELVTKMFGNRVAVSPIVTVEPRRRKFHKPITLTIPVPKAAQKGMINQYGGDAPTLRLLCSITGGTQAAQWEDITGTTPLTFVNDCVSFTTTVSARFWLMDCQNITEASRMATELYRESMSIPFMSKFVVFGKRHEDKEARLRAFCMTDDKMDKTLEMQEHFIEVARSRDVEVHEGKPQFIEMAGNLVPVTKSGEQLFINFHAFRENRLPFIVRIRDDDQDPVGRIAFMKEPKVARGEAPQMPICNLNVSLPEYKGPEPAPDLDANAILKLREKYTLIRTTTTTETYLGAELRLTKISDAVQDDWIQLAEELDVSKSQIQKCKTEFNTASDQCLYMLHSWVEKTQGQATGNELERALRKIGREDVVQSCMYNVHEVTDDMEKAMAKIQIEQSQGFDELQAEVKSRDSTMQRGASLDVSYDEQDLVKESESAAEEESESDHDSVVETTRFARRVAEEETQSIHSIQEDDLTIEISDRRPVRHVSTTEEEQAALRDKQAAYLDFVSQLDSTDISVSAGQRAESGDEVDEDALDKSHQDRPSDDYISKLTDKGVEAGVSSVDHEPEEDADFVLQQQQFTVESAPPTMAEPQDYYAERKEEEESSYTREDQISVEVTAPSEPDVEPRESDEEMYAQETERVYEPEPEVVVDERDAYQPEPEVCEPEPIRESPEPEVEQLRGDEYEEDVPTPTEEAQQFTQQEFVEEREQEVSAETSTPSSDFARREELEQEFVSREEEEVSVETTESEIQEETERSPDYEPAEGMQTPPPTPTAGIQEEGERIDESAPEMKDLIDRLADTELSPQEEQAPEMPSEEWRETEETGFVARTVKKTTYTPEEEKTPEDFFRDADVAGDEPEADDEDRYEDRQAPEESTW